MEVAENLNHVALPLSKKIGFREAQITWIIKWDLKHGSLRGSGRSLLNPLCRYQRKAVRGC